MDDKKKEEIKQEAKKILEKFAGMLEKVKAPAKKEAAEDAGTRDEGEGRACDDDFRKRMFANAPNKKEDCIVAEKGAWTN